MSEERNRRKQPFYGDQSLFSTIRELGHEATVDLSCALCGCDYETMKTKRCVQALPEERMIEVRPGKWQSEPFYGDNDW